MMIRYTTHEQSKKLLELGLDPETADMVYRTLQGTTPSGRGIGHMCLAAPRSLFREDVVVLGLPAWSLEALLEAIPKSVEKVGMSYGSYVRKVYELNLFCSYYHCCGYSFGPSLSQDNHDNLCCFGCDTWIEAAYMTAVWLFENGYIKPYKRESREVVESQEDNITSPTLPVF